MVVVSRLFLFFDKKFSEDSDSHALLPPYWQREAIDIQKEREITAAYHFSQAAVYK